MDSERSLEERLDTVEALLTTLASRVSELERHVSPTTPSPPEVSAFEPLTKTPTEPQIEQPIPSTPPSPEDGERRGLRPGESFVSIPEVSRSLLMSIKL